REPGTGAFVECNVIGLSGRFFMPKSSRRKFLGASAAAAAALGTGPAASVLSGQNRATLDSDETLALINGRIHTMDAANTIATSVTIRNGRFVAINAAPTAGPGVRI